MKKITLLTICILFSLLGYAQKEHLTFMGIPLNGTIAQFQVKLQNKGIRQDVQLSRALPSGCRAFKGVFAGEDCEIFIYYNEKTKIVYRAKAAVETNGLSLVEHKYQEFKQMLKNKYVCIEEDGKNNGYNQSVFFSNSGTIAIYITKNEYGYEQYALHIDYEDAANSLSNERKRMDDL